jgi:L-aspartate oxidase
MWEKVGVIRRGKDLAEAAKHLEAISLPAPDKSSREYYETLDMLEVARAITRSALARQESRGAHYRTDFPLKNESVPPKHSFVSRGSAVNFAETIPGVALPRARGR